MYKKTGSSYSILLHRGGKMKGRVEWRVEGGWWEGGGQVLGVWWEGGGQVVGGCWEDGGRSLYTNGPKGQGNCVMNVVTGHMHIWEFGI